MHVKDYCKVYFLLQFLLKDRSVPVFRIVAFLAFLAFLAVVAFLANFSTAFILLSSSVLRLDSSSTCAYDFW